MLDWMRLERGGERERSGEEMMKGMRTSWRYCVCGLRLREKTGFSEHVVGAGRRL